MLVFLCPQTRHVASIQSSNTNGAWVSYTYDDLNRLSTVTDIVRATTTNYTYDPASNVATVQYPNLLTSTFTYDTQNRLTELSTPPVADYKYTLGLTGIRTKAVEQGGRTVQWGYDNIYRLNNEAVTSDPNSVDGSVAYTLDPVGNRNSDTSSLSGVTPETRNPKPGDRRDVPSEFPAPQNTLRPQPALPGVPSGYPLGRPFSGEARGGNAAT